MRSITRLTIVIVAVVLMSALGFAQGNNPPASTKESGATSGHGMTGVEQGMRSNVAEEIKALQDQGRQAALKGDVKFLQTYLADSYVAVDPRGKELNRDEVINNRKTGKTKYESIDVHDSKIHVTGNTAVVVDDAVVKGMSGGQQISGEYRGIFVWAKQGGKWKLASFQAVPIQSPAAAAK